MRRPWRAAERARLYLDNHSSVRLAMDHGLAMESYVYIGLHGLAATLSSSEYVIWHLDWHEQAASCYRDPTAAQQRAN